MPIYKVVLDIQKTDHKEAIEAKLPSLYLTIGSSVKLNSICLMQFVRLATAPYMEALEGFTIYAQEGQNLYNAYTAKYSDDVVLRMHELGKVDEPSDWHYVADPMKLMGYVNLTAYPEEGIDVIGTSPIPVFIDWQLPNPYCKEAQDYDHDVEGKGTLEYNRSTGEAKIEWIPECEGLKPLLKFPEVKILFKRVMEHLVATWGSEGKYWEEGSSMEVRSLSLDKYKGD